MRWTKEAPYLYRKRGVFYFSRRIPVDLEQHYSRSRIIISLRTKSLKAARARSASLAGNLDQTWLTLRWRDNGDPFDRFIVDQADESESRSSAPTMTEARDLYVQAKQNGRSITFRQAANRSVGHLIRLCGDKPIDIYTRVEANALRDKFVAQGLSKASVKRTLNVIRAIVNFAVRELGLDDVTTFSGIYLGDNIDNAINKRIPVPTDELRFIQSQCRNLNAAEAHP